jgi:signal transduction histidine kinase
LEASSIWVVISSAGAPGVVGAYFIGNLTVRVQNTTNAPAGDLVNMAFNPSNQRPVGWVRDGPRANMAKVFENGRGKTRRGLAIVDNNANGHAQWNTLKAQGPKVSPLDILVLEWDEMFSIGLATPATVSYKNLKPGFYRFSLEGLSIMGMPSGDQASLGFEVLAPFWKTTWFWVSAMYAVAANVFAGWRYQISRQLKLENARLAQQQVLEAERFRISRDIHDDFGARVTQISLLSSSAQQREGLSPEVRADFSAVTEMSRNLVGSLYETVWAISPENDHLDSLATYICQMANQLCAQAGLKCRLQIPDLPHEIPVSSSIRHNLVMTVKEAINNIIKHAGATEAQIKVHFENGLLAIEVKDNGKGFDPSIRRRGNGLANMERRMKALGGCWTQSSKPGEGTSVRLEIRLSGNGGTISHASAGA